MTSTEALPWAVKHRPKIIQDIIGNKETIDRLVAEMRAGTLSNRILITGPTGSGKTTTAYALASWFAGEEYLPDGNSMNIVEENGANCGVDKIREFHDRTQYAPLSGKRHVIIIDECQDLTAAAKKNLNKPLESETDAAWILVTDQPHKIKDVLRGRMNRIDFKYPSADELVDLAYYVMEQEGVSLDEKTVTYIANQIPNVRMFLNVLQDLVASGLNTKSSQDMERILIKHLGDQKSVLDNLFGYMDGKPPLVNIMEVYDSWVDVLLYALASKLKIPGDQAVPNYFRNLAFSTLKKYQPEDIQAALRALGQSRASVLTGGADGVAALVAFAPL